MTNSKKTKILICCGLATGLREGEPTMTLEEVAKLYDISPTLNPNLAGFPGDQNFVMNTSHAFAKGDHLQLSSFSASLHAGAHADAPNHYHSQGEGIDRVDLNHYLGPCQVIEVKMEPHQRIRPDDLTGVKIQAPRVLFKTLSYPDPNQWTASFNSFSPELINDLGRQGVRTVGIDTPSVDPAADEELLSHQAIYQNSMAILEGLCLAQVPAGLYFLIALPIKISEADAAPVRAILIPPKST